MYNLFPINYNKILLRKSFLILKEILRMQSKNVIMNNFNLYLYFKKNYIVLNNI